MAPDARKRLRVMYATNTPAHYKTGMLDAIGKAFLQFSALYLAKRDFIRKWSDPLAIASHRYELARSHLIPIRSLEYSQMFSLHGIVVAIKYNPDVVIFGPYSQITLLIIAFIAKIRGRRSVLWYESHAASGVRTGMLSRIGRAVRRVVLRNMDAVVVPGRMAYDDCKMLGVRRTKLFIAPHSVDNDRFKECLHKRRTAAARRFRFIYIGRFTKGKNVLGLIDAFTSEFGSNADVELVLIGGDRAELPEGIPQNIFMLPFTEPERIPDVLSEANALVLPSLNEVWGLVVNEACAAGCPVIVTKCCGASEIVRNGFNGYIIERDDVVQLKGAMRLLYRQRHSIDGDKIRGDICRRYNFDEMARAFVAAVNCAMRGSDISFVERRVI